MYLGTAYWLLTRRGPDNVAALLKVLVVIGLIAGVVRGCTGPGREDRTGAPSRRGLERCARGAVRGAPSALRWSSWAAVTVPAIAAGIIIFRPRAVRSAAAVGLVALSLVGFNAVRTAEFGYSQERVYGLTLVGSPNLSFYWLLPQAYLFLLLGIWAGWRSASLARGRARQLLGRLAEPEFAGRPWALLLLPVTVIAAAMFTPNLWFGAFAAGLIWPVLLIGGAVLFIRAAPGRAAATAAAGLIGARAGWHLLRRDLLRRGLAPAG